MGNEKSDRDSKEQGPAKKSWVDFRREVSRVAENHRRHPRLEFHCPTQIAGTEGLYRITDISMGGVFLECPSPSAWKVGEALQLIMKVPTEKEPVKVNAQVANVRKRGVGLKFVNLTGKNQEVIRFCFDTFKDTIPLR